MFARNTLAPICTVLAILSGSIACSGDSESAEQGPEVQALGLNILPQTAGEPASLVAQALWDEIAIDNDYTTWPLLAGTTARQASDAPHSDLATVYFFGSDGSNPSPGDILVKENLSVDQAEPDALTVMLKVADFDPDNANWFYAKFLPDGSLDATPTGMPLAGAMEPAPGMACRGCHRNAPGEDFQWL